MSAASNYLENKLVDHLLRGQTLTAPATVYVGLSTTAPGEASFGTEVSGTAYARVAVTSSLANWAGTQGAGTTVASSGTSGLTSNNAAITFPTPGAGGWGASGRRLAEPPCSFPWCGGVAPFLPQTRSRP